VRRAAAINLLLQPADRHSTLLLGGSGFLGQALRRSMGDLIAATTHHSSRQPDQQSLPFDASTTSVKSLIAGLPHRPALAILLFGVTSMDVCARDPSGTAQINVSGTLRVIDELRELGITPVFVSSDAVFDGSKPWNREEDPARPILTYGKQKLEVEARLAALPPPWLVLRLPKLVAEDCDARCMLTGWMRALESDGELLCATDQYFTPAAVTDVARAIEALIAKRAQGLFHLGGAQRLSRRDLLALVAEEYGRHKPVRARIVDCLLADLKFAEARPRDTSLRSDRAASFLGMRFRNMTTVVKSAVDACLSTSGQQG